MSPSAKYVKPYESSRTHHRVDLAKPVREKLEDGPHAARCLCEHPVPHKDGPLVVCWMCSREIVSLKGA